MKKLIFTLLLLMAQICALCAQKITLDECLRLARSNYPEVRKLEIIRITESCDLSNASRAWLPSVTLGAFAGWGNQNADLNDIYANVTDEKTREFYKNFIQNQLQVLSPTPWRYGANLEVRQNIYDGGASSAAKSEARATAQVREAETLVSIDIVEKRVEELFFSILLLNDRHRQMESRMEVLQRNMRKMSDLESFGTGSTLSVKKIKAEIITLTQQLDVLKANSLSYRQALSLFIGRDASSIDLEIPQMPESAGRSVYENPAMKLIDSRIGLANAKLQMLDASLRPQLAFIGDLSYGYPGSNVFKSFVSHNPLFDSVLGIRLAWDITPFYTRRNNSVKIRNEIQFLGIERESLLFNIRVENSSLNSRIGQMEKALRQDDELIGLRTEIREIEEARLENGSTDADSFLDKVSEESEAVLARSIHSIELLQYRYQCRRNGNIEP